MPLEKRTRAPCGSVADNLLSIVTGASLVGAVADSETEVGLTAVASVVASSAPQVTGLVDHAIEAGVL